MGTRINILAADIHKRMVEDDRFGYSWYERYGATVERWTVDGHSFEIKVGDYDCSSSTITAWRIALAAVGVTLGNAIYTGNMEPVFLATGLFDWVPVSQAQRGDLYLNEEKHVAMCQGGGQLSEFSRSETGGISGKRGDQTGWEAKMGGYYNYPWDGCLHYKGNQEVPEPTKSRRVQLYTINGTDAQKWVPEWQKDGTVVLVSKSCGLALDVEGGDGRSTVTVQCYPKNATDAQKWKVEQISPGYRPEAVTPFELTPVVNPKLRLDVAGGSKDSGARIQVYDANGTAAQKWAVVDDGAGAWTLLNVGSLKALDVVNGGR